MTLSLGSWCATDTRLQSLFYEGGRSQERIDFYQGNETAAFIVERLEATMRRCMTERLRDRRGGRLSPLLTFQLFPW